MTKFNSYLFPILFTCSLNFVRNYISSFSTLGKSQIFRILICSINGANSSSNPTELPSTKKRKKENKSLVLQLKFVQHLLEEKLHFPNWIITGSRDLVPGRMAIVYRITVVKSAVDGGGKKVETWWELLQKISHF